MDGIFGVGLPELIVIAFVILIIGGPRNAVKWSRQLGEMIGQFRRMWTKMLAELEKEVGADGKELVDSVREIHRGVDSVRNAGSPRRLLNESSQKFGKMIDEAMQTPTQKTTSSTPKPDPQSDQRHSAWLPETYADESEGEAS